MNLRAPGDPLRRTISANMFLHSAPNGMQHLLLGIEPTTSGEHGHQAAGSDRQLAGLTPKNLQVTINSRHASNALLIRFGDISQL